MAAADIDLVGALSTLWIPVSNFVLAPFVGCATTPPPSRRTPAEVAALVPLPVAWLDRPGTRTWGQRTAVASTIDVPYFDLGPHQLWGATAMVLAELAHVLDPASARVWNIAGAPLKRPYRIALPPSNVVVPPLPFGLRLRVFGSLAFGLLPSDFRLRLKQFPPVSPEPTLGFAPLGTDRRHLAPEAAGVVRVFEVREFVQDDVVGHDGRHLHQPPIEGDGRARRAGTPPRSLIPHGDARRFQPVKATERDAARREFGLGHERRCACTAARRSAPARERHRLVAHQDLARRVRASATRSPRNQISSARVPRRARRAGARARRRPTPLRRRRTPVRQPPTRPAAR